MKKPLFIALCVLGLVSCAKSEFTPKGDEPGKGSVARIVAVLPETKMNVDTEGKITWTENDTVAVYNSQGKKFKFSVSEGAGTSSATFTCSDFTGEIGETAVYPYSVAVDGNPGKIRIEQYNPLGPEPQPIMASVITKSNESIDPTTVYFKHQAGMLELSLKDIPAYACAVKIWCSGTQVTGDFTFDKEKLDGLKAEGGTGSGENYFVTFPYKTGYGSETVTKMYIPLPAKDYGETLKVRVVDGDNEVIENTGITVPSKYSEITLGKYLAMSELNVRAKVGTARDKFTKVQKVKWAKSNLRAMSTDAGGTDKEGWQKSWGLYDNPWETQIGIVYPESTCDGSQKNNINLIERFHQGGYYSHFDYFSWGTIGRAARVHNAKVTSSVAEFDITGKVFRGTAITGGDISKFTELTGDDRFADESPLDGGSNSSMYGDLAFWASKGQYRMPTAAEITTLYTNSDLLVKGRANLQAGYYKYKLEGDTDGRTIRGILYTTVPFYKEGGLPTCDTRKDVELTDADIESGVFFPKNGERTTNTAGSYNATNIFAWNAWGVYWSSIYGGRNGTGYDDCARIIGWVDGNATSYGYTVAKSSSIWGNTAIGNCIRPVLYEE